MKLCNIAIPKDKVKVVKVSNTAVFHTRIDYTLLKQLSPSQIASPAFGGYLVIPACCIGLNSKNNPNKSQWQQRVTFKIRLNKVRAMSSLTTRDKHTERLKIKRQRCNCVILRVDSLRVLNKCLSNMLGCKGRGIE